MGLDDRMAALPASGRLGIAGADYLSILLRDEECPHNARTMPTQCPHRARTVPALNYNKKRPHHTGGRVTGSTILWHRDMRESNGYLERELCGHCAGIGRALRGHCVGTASHTRVRLPEPRGKHVLVKDPRLPWGPPTFVSRTNWKRTKKTSRTYIHICIYI